MKNILFNKRKIYLIAGITALIFILGIIFLSRILIYDGFYDGIKIEGINLKGLDKPEAKKLISDRINVIYGSKGLNLWYKDNFRHVSFEEISLTVIPDLALEEAYKIGRTGNIINRLHDIINLRTNNQNLNADIYYDKSKLRNIIYLIKKSVDSVSKNAAIAYENGRIIINREAAGSTMDVNRNIQLVENSLKDRKADIVLEINESHPLILFENLKDVNSVLSSFSTSFSLNDVNRCHNIKFACEKINGTILFPGDIFSMDKTLGPRTLENGYMDAPIIYKNELIKGPGGGVCQVTTTLYVSTLKAKLYIRERTHHSMPLGYVDMGQDATIAGSLIDLKFQNNRDYPICISANVSGDKIAIRILGKSDGSSEIVRLKSVVTEEFTTDREDVIIDDSIPDKEKIIVHEAKKGYRVVLYRLTYDINGNLKDNEMISDDIYQPIKALVKMNRNYYKADMSLYDLY
jgi:vancomycin resistance protein YoaR